MRTYRSFSWKDTNLRVSCPDFERVTRTVIARRRELEQYIARHPQFLHSLVPLDLLDDAPEAARRMTDAASLTGVGPMAAVAGTLAQLGAEAALTHGCQEAIVENGGDIYLASDRDVLVGILTGVEGLLGSELAFLISPAEMPLALCSSSSSMGHSLSLGNCDLASVVAKDASLADAAATLVCNHIRLEKDLAVVLERIGCIPGIDGILAVRQGKIALWGQLPKLVRSQDVRVKNKITRHGIDWNC